MPIPSLVANNLIPLGALAPSGLPPAPTGGAKKARPTTKKATRALAFAMQKQQQTNWCWPAVSASVAQFYSSATTWAQQCHIASSELGQTCCPPGINPGVCNIPWYLDRALTRVGHLNTWAASSTTMAKIQGEINAGRPLGARVGWASKDGHFVVVSGYSIAGVFNLVTIDDPIYGRSTISLASFQNSYQGSGSWTHTYWTR